jgi:hypothetical protein
VKKITIDDSSVSSDPTEFGSLARRRYERARVRNDRSPIAPQRPDVFRATCPWCHAPNIIMSVIDPRVASVTEPSRGDAIRCDRCRRHHVVDHSNGRRVVTFPIELPSDD